MSDEEEYKVTFLIARTVKVKAGDEIEAEFEAAKKLPSTRHIVKVRVEGPNTYADFYSPDPDWYREHDLAGPLDINYEARCVCGHDRESHQSVFGCKYCTPYGRNESTCHKYVYADPEKPRDVAQIFAETK